MPDRTPAVGLSELLDAAPAPRERQPPRAFSPRWWLRRVIAALVVAGGVWCVLYAFRIGLSFPLITISVLAVMVLRAALSLVADDPLPTEVTGAGLAVTVQDDDQTERADGLRQSVAPTDGVRFAVGRWEDRLNWGDRDPSRFVGIVVPRIIEVVDERLRQRHGFTMASDPTRARALLDADLWRFLHLPPAKNVAPREVLTIIAKVEEL
jgi:hypothetical protein